jgi:hypothetical protein
MTTPTPTVPGIYIQKDPGWLDEAWTSVPNALIRNMEVSWDAKGAYAWLASHQEMTFRVTAQLLAAAGPRGRNHAYEMVRELEKWGWLTRHRLRNPETGYTDIQVYRLHHRPMPLSERTYRPSKAKAKTAESIPVRPGTNPVEPGASENPRSEFVPDQSVTDQPVSTQSVPDQSAALKEKTKGENQGGEVTGERHLPERTPDANPPPPIFKADWRQPRHTWLCSEHGALFGDDPGADRPACRKCAEVREWAERKVEEQTNALVDTQVDRAERDRAERFAQAERKRAEAEAARELALEARNGSGYAECMALKAKLKKPTPAKRTRRVRSPKEVPAEMSVAAS